MQLSQADIMREVKRRVPTNILNEIITFVTAQEPKLWGQTQGAQFICHYMLLALYKDAFAVGYTQLYARVKKWLRSSSRTAPQHAVATDLL